MLINVQPTGDPQLEGRLPLILQIPSAAIAANQILLLTPIPTIFDPLTVGDIAELSVEPSIAE